MSTPITNATTDETTDGNGELATTPWHDVRDNQPTGRMAPLVLVASGDKPAGDRFWRPADAEGRPA